MTDFSYLGNADPAAIEGYYQQYRQQPESVDASWRKFFEGFEFARTPNGTATEQTPEQFIKESNVLNLIGAYRQRGHLFTKTNPVRTRRQYGGKLTLENFDLDESDLDTIFHAGTRIGLGPATLRDIVQMLDETYCHSVGVEYKFIRDPKVMEWLQERMESCRNRQNFTKDQKLRMLQKLMQAVTLEKFMHARFVGQKRFSLEGLEVFIPAMEAMVEIGAYFGVREFLVGMAHRGRLNILTNILGKGYQHLFWEFEGKALDDHLFTGDVKYHLGHSADRVTHNGKSVHVSLAPNPSHLEAIDPVVEGLARAKLDNLFDGDLKKVLPILVHGDSSIAGQGIVYEVLQMSQLEGYQTGGTMHIVLNNQVGFTTNYTEARSSTYCTDVAKTTLSPVFHVNADDVEAVCYVVQVALEFRQRFHRDVFIDILGYRKHGHNEGDEPRFTQPLLYKAIAKHPDPFTIYTDKLIGDGVIDAAYGKQIAKDFRAELDEAYDKAMASRTSAAPSFLTDRWAELRFSNKEDFRESPHTGVKLDELQRIGKRINHLPEDKKFFSKVEKIYADRRAMMEKGELDWASGELLAYATLLEEGFRVRISGQDSRRGTFSHRHAMVRVEDSEQAYFPLQNISDQQAPFEIYNSLLSEYGVLGFETGYAMATPDALVVWEAQFGDFVNGAQIIIDQFITGGEAKWRRGSGLVMLLPHGLEGQGPEHSSGRMERFLAECAETNMQVANITTPANLFHALRRQLHRPFRTPLIVMSPKSLLRHPQCVSPLPDFDTGTQFHEVYDDPSADPKKVKRVLLCTGKLYYELLKRQQDDKRRDVAIVRIEQLYPLPKLQLEEIINQKYSNAKEHFWVQEEPENMGACSFMRRKFHVCPLQFVTRKEACTPATGFAELHIEEQHAILEQAFAK